MKDQTKINMVIVLRVSLSLFVLFILGVVFFSNKDTRTSTNSAKINTEKTNPTKKETQLIQPTSPAWLFTNGPWKQVEETEAGTVMKGWLASSDKPHYGRRVKIETDSPFAVLKQRGIGGTLTVFVDKEPILAKDSEGKLSEIPLYKNKTGLDGMR